MNAAFTCTDSVCLATYFPRSFATGPVDAVRELSFAKLVVVSHVLLQTLELRFQRGGERFLTGLAVQVVQLERR